MPQVKCQTCQNKFYVKPSHFKLGFGKYCSRKCRDVAFRRGKHVTCEICGKEIWRTPKDLKGSKSGKFFCSKSCQTKWRNDFFSGSKHWFWKGGQFTYRTKLLKIIKRPKCRKCKTKDSRLLIVHHLDHDRKNHDIENLIWLCRNCHYLAHNHGEKVK